MTSADSGDEDTIDVRSAARGDADAFRRLYDRHAPIVFALSRWLVGDDQADDATQDVFILVWRNLRSYRGEGVFKAWLRRVAVNSLLNRRRQRARWESRHADDDLDALTARQTDAESNLDIEQAVALLPPRARDVFVLHDVEGYRHEEIAKLLGIEAGTSASQLHRARMLLRQRLQS